MEPDGRQRRGLLANACIELVWSADEHQDASSGERCRSFSAAHHECGEYAIGRVSVEADRGPAGRAWTQRAADLTLVVLLLPLVLPVAAGVALAVWLDSPGPIIYRSRRLGPHGRSFDVLKFRTMVNQAQGPAVSANGDRRYTPLGRFLARSRLDELPQLVNILRGEMRFVGPRPELEEFVVAYRADYDVILTVPPGLTGRAQLVYASEGAVLAAVGDDDRERLYLDSILPWKVRIDRHYAQHRTAWGDLIILVRTLLLPLSFFAAAIRNRWAGSHELLLTEAARAGASFVLLLVFLGLFMLDGMA